MILKATAGKGRAARPLVPLALLLLAAMFAGGGALSALSLTEGASRDTITSIQIEGLKRTKPRTAHGFVRRFIGRDAAALDLDEVRAAIVDGGILDPLSVEVRDGADGFKTLHIEVADKWSIFPVPVFAWSSDGFTAGGAFFDANAFGINDKMGVVGIYSQNSWLAAAMYSHSPAGGRLSGSTFSASYTRGRRELRDQKLEVYDDYDAESATGGAGLSFRVGEDWTWEARVSFNAEARDGADWRMSLPLSAQVRSRRSEWDGVLLSERRFEAGVTADIGLNDGGGAAGGNGGNGGNTYRLQSSATWERPLSEGFRYSVNGGVLYSLPTSGLTARTGAPPASRVVILPASFSASSYADLSAGLEKALFRWSLATLSVSAAYQIVCSEGEHLGACFDHGPSAGVRVYLRRLAIPAVGARASYNAAANQFIGAFSMGMSL